MSFISPIDKVVQCAVQAVAQVHQFKMEPWAPLIYKQMHMYASVALPHVVLLQDLHTQFLSNWTDHEHTQDRDMFTKFLPNQMAT